MHRAGQLAVESSALISQIIRDLGELYHDAAIISYLENMESVGYRDGVDEPVELQVHLSSIDECARRIRDRAEALAIAFRGCDLYLDISTLVEAVNDIIDLIQQVKSYRDLDQFVLSNNQLMTAVDRLRTKVQGVVKNTGELICEVMPVSLEARSLGRITYADVRRNPQAIVQYAFTSFESHLRKRIGAGSELYGENLINQAYGGNGNLSYGAVPSERVGARNFMSGAYAVFRNPRMHRTVEENEQMAVKLLVLVDLLIKLVDESENTTV